MARLLATELKGDSENQLFYGAAAQFVGKLAEVRACTVWRLSWQWRPCVELPYPPTWVPSHPVHGRVHPTSPHTLVPPPPTHPRLQDITKSGGLIYTSSPVRHIDQKDGGVDVYSDTLVATGKYVVVATPPHLSGRITYTPPLPARRAQLTQRMPMVSRCAWQGSILGVQLAERGVCCTTDLGACLCAQQLAPL